MTLPVPVIGEKHSLEPNKNAALLSARENLHDALSFFHIVRYIVLSCRESPDKCCRWIPKAGFKTVPTFPSYMAFHKRIMQLYETGLIELGAEKGATRARRLIYAKPELEELYQDMCRDLRLKSVFFTGELDTPFLPKKVPKGLTSAL